MRHRVPDSVRHTNVDPVRHPVYQCVRHANRHPLRHGHGKRNVYYQRVFLFNSLEFSYRFRGAQRRDDFLHGFRHHGLVGLPAAVAVALLFRGGISVRLFDAVVLLFTLRNCLGNLFVVSNHILLGHGERYPVVFTNGQLLLLALPVTVPHTVAFTAGVSERKRLRVGNAVARDFPHQQPLPFGHAVPAGFPQPLC